MSLGAGTLNTNQKRETGGPFATGSADNGLSVDAGSGHIVLGNDLGDAAAPGKLLNNRNIERNGFALNIDDAVNGIVFSIFGSSPTLVGPAVSFIAQNNVNSQLLQIYSSGLLGKGGVATGAGAIEWFPGVGQGCILHPGTNPANPGVNNLLIDYAAVRINGTLRNDRFVSPQAASPVAVSSSADKNKVFTNEGAGAAITFNLPAAAVGLSYTFYVQNANGVVIDAAAGDTIRILALVTAAGGSVSSVTVGSSVILVAINATEWVAIAALGTWV